jgi:hypothetical protein
MSLCLAERGEPKAASDNGAVIGSAERSDFPPTPGHARAAWDVPVPAIRPLVGAPNQIPSISYAFLL